MSKNTTHFGYEEVPIDEKVKKVGAVFSSVAKNYDIMNDLMSMGSHRLWKRFAVGTCQLRTGEHVLDLAAGSGDLTKLMSPIVGPTGSITMADINAEMLQVGRDRIIDTGCSGNVRFSLANAECLPFADNSFDCVIIGFGLRNVTDKDKALASMHRVLKPGGRLIVLEFSKPTNPLLTSIYDLYSFKLLPKIGKWIADDEDSYQYLSESIRMHPDQNTLSTMMETAGFEDCQYHNLFSGIVAVHKGFKY